jgi:large repetitive protein
VLGGNASIGLHGYYYLTSPAINLTSASGTVNLTFWRWLNSDYTPYMNNVIEVFNGSTWVQIWQSGPPPAVQDAAWVRQTFNVTSYKSSAFRVRFGFNVDSPGVWTVSSWNVDDVTLGSGTCL